MIILDLKTNYSLNVVNFKYQIQLWPVFCRRRNGSPLCDTVTVTAELDELTVTALNEEQTFTNSRWLRVLLTLLEEEATVTGNFPWRHQKSQLYQ